MGEFRQMLERQAHGANWVRNAPNGFGCRPAKIPTSTWAGSVESRMGEAVNNRDKNFTKPKVERRCGACRARCDRFACVDAGDIVGGRRHLCRRRVGNGEARWRQI